MALFEHFTVLDGLAQVIYQDPYEFALISKVHQMDKYSKKHRYDISEDTSRVGWEVYIGLPEMGRWWRGWWRETDVMALVETQGPKKSARMFEALGWNVSRAISKGELFISNARDALSSKDTPMEMKIGPANKGRLSVKLNELETQDARMFTSRELYSLIRHSQTQNCYLYPTKDDRKIAGPSNLKRASPPTDRKASTSDVKSPPRKRRAKEVPEGEEPNVVKMLREEVEDMRRKIEEAEGEIEYLKRDRTPSPGPVVLKLGNPHRAPRKLLTMEFISDDES